MLWVLNIHIAKGSTIDDHKEEIFQILQGDRRVIYFHGWDGFGASVVLRSIAEVLPYRRTTPELCFDRIIYVDCSEWKNRRAAQRAIAEELELDNGGDSRGPARAKARANMSKKNLEQRFFVSEVVCYAVLGLVALPNR